MSSKSAVATDFNEAGMVPADDGDVRTIGICVVSRKLRDISVPSQKFSALVIIFLDWFASPSEIKSGLPEWNPADGDVSFPNLAVSEAAVDPKPPMLVETEDYGFQWRMVIEIDGPFMQNYDLRNFPVDVQNLTVKIASGRGDRGTNAMRFVPTRWHQYELVHQHVDDVMAETKLLNGKAVFIDTDPDYSSAMRSYSQFWVELKVQRIALPYLFRVLFFLEIISFVTLWGYRIEKGEQGSFTNRLNHSATMLLVTTTFLFIVNNYLPLVTYLTILDKCGILYFLFIFLVLVGEVITTYRKFEYVENGLVGLFVWAGIQIIIAMLFVQGYYAESRKKKKSGNDYVDYVRARSGEKYEAVYKCKCRLDEDMLA
eukprot:CAMPEP_0184021554 /NCGR_PEP_ID=MMETSP0954-20121128/10004_1 /TAXON_ID=627963 /ORGANISM="Aplanochytrium sp, Strain PBS07" /LENGTH=370 /DNA_ID=CAMNT_0026303609 /DNA_START=27 /DNA_END=1135 /DNA_ORIENTATION=+